MHPKSCLSSTSSNSAQALKSCTVPISHSIIQGNPSNTMCKQTPAESNALKSKSSNPCESSNVINADPNSNFLYTDKSVEILITNVNTSYIKVAYQNHPLKFLIDTGANVSLIKWESLPKSDLCYDNSEILTLNGISANSPVRTVGIINLPLSVHNKLFNAKFHVVKEKCNIPFDGLIGSDVLKNQKALINYEKSQLKLSSLPFPIPLRLKSEVSNNKALFLQPRSETLIEIDILNYSVKEGICPETKINEGVFLAKAILKVNSNKKTFTTILNTNDRITKIDPIQVTLEPFKESSANIFNVRESNNP